MSAHTEKHGTTQITQSLPFDTQVVVRWWPIVVGCLLLYVPTYLDLLNGPWSKDDAMHGPLVVIMVTALVWRSFDRERLFTGSRWPRLGWSLLGFGLLLYPLGRSQGILMIETFSQIPVFAGLLLMFEGSGALRRFALPLLLLCLVVPLPGVFIDGLTQSLKQSVSATVEALLYHLGYPIGREGVTLTVGPYRLLVADACSGMNSLFSLSALAIFYLSVVERPHWLHKALLLVSALPIAILANIIRVVLLILITYHFGDEAGQGYLHDFASLALFVTALATLFVLDKGLLASLSRHQVSA